MIEVNFVYGFSRWKLNWILKFIKKPIFLKENRIHPLIIMLARIGLIKVNVYVWGYSDGLSFKTNCYYNVTRIEDGFIRSQGLGCEKIPPVSIIMDRSGYLYFDGARRSELDSLIENYQFSEEELKISEDFLNVISSSTTNKYNLDVCSTLPKKVGVLVIGQVESDLSVIHGKGFATNLELIKLAIKENPSEPIYYKRHPDILAGKREVEYGLDEILKISEVIDFELSQEVTPEVFKTVYVNTSLLGFELLIRGFIIRVTGRPFYWGLGLTNDLQYDSSRRNISLQKLAYIVYVLYPVYSSGNWAFIDKKVKEILFEKANYGLS